MRSFFPKLRVLFALTFVAAGAGCSTDDGLNEPLFKAPDNLVEYETSIIGMPDDESTELAESALSTFRREDEGAQSIAFLKRRAESDEALILKLLRSRGYYRGSVEITVTDVTPAPEPDPDVADPAVNETSENGTDEPPEKAERQAEVLFDVDPGEVFILASQDLPITSRGPAPELDAKDLGAPIGGPAVAASIIDTETHAVTMLKDAGFPYAEKGTRNSLADLEEHTIEVVTPLDAGPLSIFGPLTFEGLSEVEEDYLRTYLDFEVGQTFSQKELEDYQGELLSTDLFDTLSVRAPDDAPDGEAPVALPITVSAKERKKRTVSAAARYNTDDGPSVLFGYENRNLFGANETFTAEAIAGLDLQRIAFGYREPQYLRDGQDFTSGFVLEREEDDAFDALTATLTAGLERSLNPFWTVGGGGLLEASLIDDEITGETESYLAGLPAFAEYDGSNDLLNPTKGIRFRADVIPFIGQFDGDLANFLSIDTKGSTYYDFTGSGDYVLAGRGRFGSIIADDVTTVPDTRRLYSGGGNSVRGYQQRFIGPLDANDDPTGGLSAVELGIEMRATLVGALGGVIFVDAGSVSEEVFPAFEEGVQVAAGLGFRFYSPAGPIRVDIAFPVNGRDVDDTFQFYFSIGQAF